MTTRSIDRNQRGASLLELIGVLAIMGITLGAASMQLRTFEAPLKTGAKHLEGTLRAARLKAMATTSSYRVAPTSNNQVAAEWANSCGASTWTTDADLDLELPDGVTLGDTSWSVCFSSRGISSSNVVLGLNHPDYGTAQVEVLLGGTTRVIE